MPETSRLSALDRLQQLDGLAILSDDSGMPPLIFISYRRNDSPHATFGVFDQLRARIGPGSVFMDQTGILPGDQWPERLRQMLNQATIVLALIGPEWLKTADEYGRRRLDDPNDWVRNELSGAFDAHKPIIPILLGSLSTMPPTHALPTVLTRLCSFQAYSLRDDRWQADLNELVRLLIEKYGFIATDQEIQTPKCVTLPHLTPSELERELATLDGWEPVESPMPGKYPKFRQELRKAYQFRSFDEAIKFMNAAIEPINQLGHHPRWENQWQTVMVYLSSWDIGSRISSLDIELAKLLDKLFASVR